MNEFRPTTEDMAPDVNFMADDADRQPDKHNTKKDEKDEHHGLPEELWPHQEQMQEWIANHLDDVSSFLNNRGAKYELVCGDGFYHQPEGDKICLSVPYFKECLESGTMTLDQIFFGTLHEIAHLKTMWEQDLAGKMNQLEQFNYERGKKVRDSKDPTRYADISSGYRQFYNILEDAVVNRMVLNTRHFGEISRPENYAQIGQLYTDKFFALYQKSAGGNYIKSPEGSEVPFEYVGEGKGDYRVLKEDDYEKGFDWNSVEPPLERSGQFLTFFIKNQMLELKGGDVAATNNPEGKYKMREEVAEVLLKPLIEVYPYLLQKIDEKYKNDAQKRKTYLQFLTMNTAVRVYKPDGRKVTESGIEVYNNVMRKEFVQGDHIDIRTASIDYKQTLEKALRSMELNEGNAKTVNFIDLFDRFKDIDRRPSSSWTFPLKHNLAKRTKIMRQILEPIYSMLCILDDSFDVALPPETPPSQGDPNPPKQPEPENPEKPEWGVGDKVVHVNPNGEPILVNGQIKKGQITDKNYDQTGKIISVEVEWFEPSETTEMRVRAMDKFSGKTEKITNPYAYLRLWQDEGEEKLGKRQKNDPRKPFKQEKDKKKEDKNKEEDQDEDQDRDQDQESEPNGESMEEKMSSAEKILRDMIESDIRKANKDEAEDQRNTKEYKDKVGKDIEAKVLARALKEARERQGLPEPDEERPELQDEAIVAEFQRIQEMVRPYSERMAKAWLEVTRNISSQIDVLKEKYFRSGSPDIKKIQKFLPEIELGADIEMRLVYERIVEKIKVELRPKILRLSLLIDNSGSMDEALGGDRTKVEQVRVAIMLLNSSLRSLRGLFKEQMKDVLGYESSDIDLVCDTEINLFGSSHKIIKPYEVNDLSFVDNEHKQKPKIDIDRETLNTLLAFQRLTVDEGTYDEEAWKNILANRVQNSEVCRLLREKKMTEVLLQISDGEIFGNNPMEQIVATRSLGISTAGFAIGSSSAIESLGKRHDVVISANTAEEIVEQFADLLVKIVKEKVEKPMEDILKSMEPE